jgi:hypothetical protein
VKADEPDVCPTGHGPLKFTLMPPPGREGEPITGLPGGPEDEDAPARKPGGLLSHPYAMPIGVAILAGVILLGAAWHFSGEGFDARAKKIKPGMRMREVVRIMGGDPDQKPSNRPFPHVDMTPPTDGDGEVTWEGGLSAVTVHFRDGIVTSVEHGDAQGGMRKKVTTSGP